MLGGGTFVSQNKKLPGSYINFVSAARANTSLGERGYVAMPLELDWGVDGDVFTVTNLDFYKNSRSIFGYEYSHAKMKGLRDLFMHTQTAYFYKLGTGVKAFNEFAEAKYAGKRGNDLKIVIVYNDDDQTKFDVMTYLDNKMIDSQTVTSATKLVDNDFLVFEKDAELVETAGTPLSNGSNGTVTASDWQDALEALESFSFNVIGAVTTDAEIKKLVAEWTKTMRDDVGVKFQAVVYDYAADDKGVINVVSKPKVGGEAELVYWVAGAEAGCPVNASLTNTVYDGEYDVDVKVSQAKLAEALEQGKFIFHRVGDGVRVLEDINSKVTVTEEENEDFMDNQTVRIIDQIAMDIATIFNTRFLGKVRNDASGRISLKNAIVSHHEQLQRIGAIEDFDSEDVVVSQGETKKSVVVEDAITATNSMNKFYMTCVVA